ncbi:PrsW family intramembrane metalloprotease [Phormidium tenue FACHB-886]|nr:PrsW family intramembrane metalloprotease [Phormidium tenue FACHB-886]
MPPENSPLPMPSRITAKHTWWRVFLIGLLLYVISIVLTVMTGNPNLFPTMILLGNFLIPITFVIFLYERQHLSSITFSRLMLCLFYGGVLGICAAGFLEPLLLSYGRSDFVGTSSTIDLITAFKIGLIEEFVKGLVVVFMARNLRHTSELNGLLIGAAVGMGFAALESTGYAFSVFLDVFAKVGEKPVDQEAIAILFTVVITALRSLLAPFGHAVWTALLAAVLFRESSSSRFRLTGLVVLTYFTVALLHGLWDGLPGLITVPFVNLLSLLIVGIAGLLMLVRVWKNALYREGKVINHLS